MKKTFWLVLLLFTLVCSACGADATTSISGTNLDFPGYWHMVVNLVSSNATVPGNYVTADPGTRLIELQVVATNIQQSDSTGAGSQINISDFFLYPVGSNTQMRRAYGKNNFSGGTIPPGSTGTITIYYQVPTQAGMYELDFQLHAVYAGTHHCDITVPSGN